VGSALVLWLLCAAPAAASPVAAGDAGRGRIYLVALGEFPAGLADEVGRAIRAEYGLEVVRLRELALPAAAYYPPRRRYRAEKLAVFLQHQLPRDAPARARILGLTSVDISTTKGKYEDWGVFGLAEIGGRPGVVSSFRLRRGSRNAAHLSFRLRSAAVHEVGHALGLQHCRESRCAMLDAEGSIQNTDKGTGHLGPGCRAKLKLARPLVLDSAAPGR
jgi:archaemetzincin